MRVDTSVLTEDQVVLAEVLAEALYRIRMRKILRGVKVMSISEQSRIRKELLDEVKQAFVLTETDHQLRKMLKTVEKPKLKREPSERQKAHLERLNARLAQERAAKPPKRPRKIHELSDKQREAVAKMHKGKLEAVMERQRRQIELTEARMKLVDQGLITPSNVEAEKLLKKLQQAQERKQELRPDEYRALFAGEELSASSELPKSTDPLGLTEGEEQ